MVASTVGGRLDWIVLVYRVPRVPSSPRIAIWRRLRALGVGQLGDGVAALPEDARTREHLEWVADQVLDAGGTALLLRGQALALRDEQRIARRMAEVCAEEYQELAADARLVAEAAGSRDDSGDLRALKRLRRDLRAITRRDYFPPPEREQAVAAVTDLARILVGPRSEPRTTFHAAEPTR